jgi:hypothetical protein
MCATGSFTANGFGLPTLAVKLVGVFLYGLWIVVNYFDISSENYPLLKQKYIFLLCLIPLLLLDITLQTLYIAKLEPDIITSCCAVVFGDSGQSSTNLLSAQSQPLILSLFYGLAAVLLCINAVQYKTNLKALVHINALFWISFLLLALLAITTVFSSYVYAMPYHRCPFCILKKEYHYLGLFQYLTLLLSVFFGAGASPVLLMVKAKELQNYVQQYIRFSVIASSLFLGIFVALTSYHLVGYRFFGGE